MKKLILLPLLALLLTGTSTAAEFQYFLADPQTLIPQIPPPPADDSLAGKTDVETLLQVQNDRTPAQVARAETIAHQNPMQMGSTLFGPDFTAQNLPRTAALFKAIDAERHLVTAVSKDHWNRTRPYDRGLGIEPSAPRPSNSSYPSGHTSAAATWARIYIAAFPEYKNFFETRVRETMWCRVIAGVHYPTDTQAGLILGNLIADEMLKSPATQKAVVEIRSEIQSFLKTHPAAATRAQSLSKK